MNILQRHPKITLVAFIFITLTIYRFFEAPASIIFFISFGVYLYSILRRIPLTKRMKEINITSTDARKVAESMMKEHDMPIRSLSHLVPVEELGEIHWRFFFNWIKNGKDATQIVDISAVDGSITRFMPSAFIPEGGLLNENERYQKKEGELPRILKEEIEREVRTGSA